MLITLIPLIHTYRTVLSINQSIATLGDFEDLTVAITGPRLPDEFSLEQVALTFIAAMAAQALDNYNELLSSYVFVDTQHADNPVRFVIDPALGANPVFHVRRNVIWCLQQLSEQMFREQRIWGLNFVEKYRGRNLYLGSVTDRNRPILVLDDVNNGSSLGTSTGTASARRALAEDSSNITSSMSSGLGDPDIPDIDIDLTLTGSPLPKVEVFTSILDFIFWLAPEDKTKAVTRLAITRPHQAWIFVKYSNDAQEEIGFGLQVHHAIRLARAAGEHYVSRQVYRELVFRLTVRGKLLAEGCVTKGVRARNWCAGMDLTDGLAAMNGTEEMLIT